MARKGIPKLTIRILDWGLKWSRLGRRRLFAIFAEIMGETSNAIASTYFET